MRRSSRYVVVALALGAVLGLAACGSEDVATSGDPDGSGSATTSATTPKQTEKQKPAAGTGNVQGTVLYDDKPAAGIEVTLCAEYSSILGTCGGSKHTAKTEADGVFVVADVPPAEYQGLLVRVFDTDLVQFVRSGVVSSKTYSVTADKTLFVDVTHLFKSDLKVTAPASGSQVPPANLELRWDAYPSATYYKVTLSAKEIGGTSPVINQRVDGTSYVVPTTVASGEYRVKIEAFNAKDHKLTEAPDGYSFIVSG